MTTAPSPVDTPTVTGDRLVHAFCHRCQPFQTGATRTALCGHTRVQDGSNPDASRCVVCADLFDQPCPKCGAT